jgi:Zn-dependent protease with chaperone function/peroxiredoxin
LTTKNLTIHILSLLLVLWLVVSPALADKKQKPLKKRDNPQLVGKRDINKGQINLYSLEKGLALGRQMAAEMDRRSRLVDDPIMLEFVNRITQNIVINSDVKVLVTVKVIDSSYINAFTLPGGFLYINRGLIEAADNEAELAGVIAHELAHIAAQHGVEQATKGNLISWAAIPLIFFGGWSGFLVNQTASMVIPLSYFKFSRSAEKEADRLATQYLWKTGYDPQGLITFFEKLQASEKKDPGTLKKVYRTHPMSKDRIKEVQKLLVRFPEQSEYQINSSDFIALKERMGIFSRGRRIEAERGDQRLPTLKRHRPEKSDQPDETDENEQPTLKRRWQDSQLLSAFALLKPAIQTDQLTFRSVDGKRVSLTDHKGHVVVLVFNGTWVPMLNRSIPALQRIANLYENRGAVFYWVSINSARVGDESYISDAGLKDFARENGLQLTVLRDPERQAFRAFGLDALPSIVIIDSKGKVYKKHAGFDPARVLGYEVITRALNQLL